MKFFSVNSMIAMSSGFLLHAFHRHMFHGTVLPHDRIKKNLVGHPYISQPSLSLLVSNRVRETLPRHPGIQFRDVDALWYEYEWEKGSVLPWNVQSDDDVETFVESLAEVVPVPRIELSQLDVPTVFRIPYGVKSSPWQKLVRVPYDSTIQEEYWMDPAVLEEAGCIALSPAHAFRTDVFEKIFRFFDTSFFQVTEISF